MPWIARTRLPGTVGTWYICDVEHPVDRKVATWTVEVNAARTDYTLYYCVAAGTPGGTDVWTLPIFNTGKGGRVVNIIVKLGGSEVTRDTPIVRDGTGGGGGKATRPR